MIKQPCLAGQPVCSHALTCMPRVCHIYAVGLAISLPHCQADASISQATVKAKQEALQLHTVLGAAGQSAAAGDQAAVVDALAPVLLCNTDKEQQMLQLDEQQWLRGMHMLLSAASASGSLGLVLRCHLRLLNALLPAVPPQLLPLLQGREDAADSQAAAALHAAAEQLMARREAAGALDAAASFLQQHCAALSLPAAAECSSGSAEQQPRQKHQVALHPMELAMFEEVQQQAALAVASCAASLAAAGPAAAESALNLKASGLGPQNPMLTPKDMPRANGRETALMLLLLPICC